MICSKIVAVGLHLASWHSVEGYNNVNGGLYVRNECGIQAGVYYNSERKISTYATYTLENDSQPFFAVAGIIAGYKNRNFTPMAGVGIKIRNWRVLYVPKFAKYNDTHLLHLTYEF